MPDVKNNIIWTLRDEVSQTARKLQNNLDAIGIRGKGATSVMSKLGMATGGLVTPTTLAAGAALALGAGLVEATRSAIADEESQNRLRASLVANIPAFDGSTDAIEANISAAQRLAFSDEELRDSLTVLVGATHDVGKAQEIMATAMDLARFKGVDLRTASEALIKVEGGHYRALAQLGIKLREGADSTEAMAAVQKVAAGQAEAFADTTVGAMEGAQIAVDELVEDIGRDLVPVVKEFAVALRDDVIPALRATGDIIGPLVGAVGELATGLHSVNPAGNEVIDTFQSLQDRADELGVPLEGLRDKLQDMGESARTNTYDTATGLGEVTRATEAAEAATALLAQTTSEDLETAALSWEDYVDRVTGEADDLIDKAFDPIIAHDKLVAQNAETAAARRELAAGKATAAERAALDESMVNTAEYVTTLAEAGETNSKAYKTGIANLEKYVKEAKGATKARLQEMIDKIKELERVGKRVDVKIYFTSKYGPSTHAGGGATQYAEGGYVDAPKGQPVAAIVHGGEYVIPEDEASAMSSLPAASWSGGGGWGGSPTVVHLKLYLDGHQIAAAVEAASYYPMSVAESATTPA